MKSINPFNNELIEEYPEDSADLLHAKIDKAFNCWNSWKKTGFEKRASVLKNCANILRSRKESFAQLISLEMGKLISEARGELTKCAWVCDYYAENGQKMLKETETEADAINGSFVAFEPLGPILGVMPWNFPFWQVFRFAAPALMAGNTCLLKHASNVSGSGIAIEGIFREAGLPTGGFITLFAKGGELDGVITSSKVRAVTLTGSETAGRAVASAAGKGLKKSVLELGGSDPFIVFDDADMEKAVEGAVLGRMLNCGQSCIAAKRFIVHEKIEKEFLKGVIKSLESFLPGDPLKETTSLAPLARIDIKEDIEEQMKKAVASGDQLLFQGCIPELEGNFFAPAVIKCESTDSILFRDETFGPLMAVSTFRDYEEAIDIANTSSYGLGASIWSENREKAKKLARQVESGAVFINSITKSDPRLPFGGVKLSGYGRELSDHGIKEFVNVKTIWVD